MLVAAERQYGSRGVVFVGASLDDSKTKRQIPDFIQKYEVGYPIWYGASGDELVWCPGNNYTVILSVSPGVPVVLTH